MNNHSYLEDFDVKIDFSGGDPLASAETFIVMKRAKELFGQDNITLTSTGPGLKRADPDVLINLISELNFTFDQVSVNCQGVRPNGYNISNLLQIKKLIQKGIKVRAETPLTIRNVDPEILEKIYLQLHESGVQKHLIMRFFPVGRAEGFSDLSPTTKQLCLAIEHLRNLEAKYGFPKIRLQCALKYLENKQPKSNPCDAGELSFGLTSNGILLLSPWAINKTGEPLSADWILGSLIDFSLKKILSSEKHQKFLQNCNQNFGHCKIHSYLNAKNRNFKSIFSPDPLYE